jgi:hypothetical protein
MKPAFIRLLNFIVQDNLKARSFFLLVVIYIFTASSAYCGDAAPYTEEAVKKVEAAFKQISLPKNEKNLSHEERRLKSVELMRIVYKKAGYSYDATIVQIAEDIQNHPERIPMNSITIANHVIAGIHVMMSECKYTEVDCLKFFDADTAKAIKTLMRITEFSM